MTWDKTLTTDELAAFDADLAKDGLVRLSEPRINGTMGRSTRAQAEQVAIDLAAHRDPSRPNLRWLAWVLERQDGYWGIYTFVVEVGPAPTSTDTYTATNIWRTGWTTDTAHYLISVAPRHGRARHTMMLAACGQRINPGFLVDPAFPAIHEGVTLCGSCQAKLAAKPKAAAVSSEKILCADCGQGRASKTSAYCSICRPYHPHATTRLDSSQRKLFERQGWDTTACGMCGQASSEDIHQAVQS